MKIEQIFGANAGKVWAVLNENKKTGPLTFQEIMKLGRMTRDDVMSGLGWLGREGKIEVLEDKEKYVFRLL